MQHLLLALLLVLAPIAGASVVDRVAAVVEDEVIALSQVYELGEDYIAQRCQNHGARCHYNMELEVLDALIKRVLIRQELERLGLRVSGREIDQAINQVVAENGLADRQELRAALKDQGISWDAFRDDLGEQMRLQRFQGGVLAPRVTVRQDEIEDAYKRTARDSRQEEIALDAIGILIPDESTPEEVADAVAGAAALVGQLNSEELSWQEAVGQHDSAGLAQVVAGQRYIQGALHASVDAVAFQAEVGVVQPPIKVGNVLFIVKVTDKGMGEARVVPLEEVEDQLRNALFQEKVGEAEEEWYQRARRLAAVEILIPEPED